MPTEVVPNFPPEAPRMAAEMTAVHREKRSEANATAAVAAASGHLRRQQMHPAWRERSEGNKLLVCFME